MNYNIQTLLRSLSNQQQPQGQPTGIDPNLALVMQAMGMMTKQMDTQGRPIIPGQTNPSLMDQHYARQQNPQAMADRYGAPMFSQGPARVQGPQMPITARQSVEGLPGQVGPAMSLNQTPINMSPTAQENADMQAARVWAQQQNAAKQSAPRQTPWRPTGPIGAKPPDWQGPPSGFRNFGYVPQGPLNVGAWQGPPMPTAQQEAANISDVARRQWEAGQRPPVPMPMIAGMPDLSGQVRAMAPGTPTYSGPNGIGKDRSAEIRAMPPGSPTFNMQPFNPFNVPMGGKMNGARQLLEQFGSQGDPGNQGSAGTPGQSRSIFDYPMMKARSSPEQADNWRLSSPLYQGPKPEYTTMWDHQGFQNNPAFGPMRTVLPNSPLYDPRYAIAKKIPIVKKFLR